MYYYAAYLWSQGVIPYRDFFLSHPPLQIALPAMLITLFGVKISLLNALPIIAGALSGILTFLITRRSFGRNIALLAAFLFLFSFTNFSTSLFYSGQNGGLTMLLLGFLLFLKKKDRAAGLTLGLGMAMSINVLIGFIAICALLVWKEKKRLRAIALGFLTTFGIVHIIFTILAGKAFWEQVYLFHFQKIATVFLANKWAVLFPLEKLHAPLMILTIIALILIATKGSWKKDRVLQLSLSFIFFYILFLIQSSVIFPHYIVFLAPFFAILSAYGISELFPAHTHSTKKWQRLAVIPLMGVIYWNAGEVIQAVQAQRSYYQFDHAVEIADFLREDLTETETVYGGFSVTPLVALLAEKRIAGNQVDSSVMRLQSGIANIKEVITKIEEDNVQVILTRPLRGVSAYIPFLTKKSTRVVLEQTMVITFCLGLFRITTSIAKSS